MPNTQLKAEIRQLGQETLHLRNDFESLSLKFEQLRQDYENSKSVNPFSRYASLKHMIIEAATPIRRQWML